MKKLIFTTIVIFTALSTFAEVGQQDTTDCSKISNAKDIKSSVPAEGPKVESDKSETVKG